MTPEGLIKRQICDYLNLFSDRCFFWVTQSHGVWDQKRKIFLNMRGRYQIKGVSDIMGIWDGKPLAIEVKTKTGKLSDHQKIFLAKFQDYGGIAFVARSVEDVKNYQGLNILI